MDDLGNKRIPLLLPWQICVEKSFGWFAIQGHSDVRAVPLPRDKLPTFHQEYEFYI